MRSPGYLKLNPFYNINYNKYNIFIAIFNGHGLFLGHDTVDIRKFRVRLHASLQFRDVRLFQKLCCIKTFDNSERR